MIRIDNMTDKEYIAFLEARLAEYEKAAIKPPTLSEVINFFRANGYKPKAAEDAFNYYEKIRKAKNGRVWRDVNDRVIKNWKLKMRTVWFKPENKMQNEIQRGF